MKITKTKLKKIIQEELKNPNGNAPSTVLLTEINLGSTLMSISRKEGKREQALAKTLAYLRDLMDITQGTPALQQINDFYLQVKQAMGQLRGQQ